MNGDEPAGVVFPASADGRRSTSALGRAVVAEALAQVDPAGSHGAEHEANWRTGYLAHFRRLIEAGLASRQDAVSVARDGLESLHRRMRVAGPGGAETGLDALVSAPAHGAITTVTVTGTGVAEGSLSVPYRGEALRGDALLCRLEAWVAAGVIEPSCADAVRMVAAHPDWLALPGRTIVVLGAGAEIGPLPVLLSWGARAIGIDLPRPFIWQRVLEMARRSAGTLLVPVAGGSADQAQPAASSAAPAEASSAAPEASGAARAASGDLAQCAGLDLTGDVPTIADWLASVDGPLVLGNYVYADGAANVRVASAVDALTVRLQASRRDVTLAFLATPTDVFAVPADAVAQAVSAYLARSLTARLGGWPLHALSGGRLLRRAYPPGADPGICDGQVPQQGPNYALGQTHAALAGHAGQGRRRNRLAERRPADPHQVGHEEPGPGRRVRGRAPVRRGGLRSCHLPGAHGGAAGTRPAHRRRTGAGPALAGRGARGGPRRALARRVCAPQRARARGAARLPSVQRPHGLTARGRAATGRAGTTKDIAATVMFLASPAAGHVTGQVIHVNGGSYLGF